MLPREIFYKKIVLYRGFFLETWTTSRKGDKIIKKLSRKIKKNEKLAAEKDKEIAIINSKKKSETTKIEAEGQAEANRKLAKSLSNNVVQYEWIKKWEGQLPKVSGSSNMIQIPGNMISEDK